MKTKLTNKRPGKIQQRILQWLIFVAVLSVVYFLYGFFTTDAAGNPWLYGMLAFIMVYSMLRKFGQWWYYLRLRRPVEPPLTEYMSVDVLTTYYPGEPREMVKNTLLAIGKITYPHTAYLCDEANDPELKEFCEQHGVVHVTRENFVNAKAGNINNALQQATGEICLILDPDHIPQPDFLDRVVPYFQDPAIGFVQVVQAYYNKTASLVAKGAAQQTFHFYGPVMMGMYGYGTVDAIGANCTFRRSALDGIGGHAPGLAEDMHTCMLLYAEGWQSVYVPELVAEGLSPATLTAYYKQQLKWSRGTFDLLFKVYPRIFSSLSWPQRIHFPVKAIHYSYGLVHLAGFLIPILSLFLLDTPWKGDFLEFVLLIAPVIASTFVIRLYVQQWLISDNERGFHLVGGILEIVTWWVYTVGFLYALINRKVPYLPTPKEEEDVTHPSLLVPNIVVGMLSIVAVIYGLSRDLTPYSIVMAIFALANAFLMFASVYLALGITNRTSFIRGGFEDGVRGVRRSVFDAVLWSLNSITIFVRRTAPLLLLVAVLLSVLLLRTKHQSEFALAGASLSEPYFYPPNAADEEEQELDSLSCARQLYTDLSYLATTNALLGVDYLKISDWRSNRYGMTRSSMEADFGDMKKAGVQLVRTTRPGIYQRNLFVLAEKYDLKVVLFFQAPFIVDPEDRATVLSEWREEVLKTVNDLKNEPSVVAWELHTRPQRPAEGSAGGTSSSKLTSDTDSWMEPLLDDVQRTDNVYKRKAYVIDCQEGQKASSGGDGYRMYGNWQDVWRDDQLTFDGFLDVNGNKKSAYRKLIAAKGQSYPGPYLPAVNILPTAEPLYTGQTTEYTAMVEQDIRWVPAVVSADYTIEWKLIKLNRWGEPLAFRVIGHDPTLSLEVPENYTRYQLGVSLTQDGYVRFVSTPLNLPLYQRD